MLKRGPPETSIYSTKLCRSCCLKTAFVVFVAKNCWFYQHIKKISTINENWALRLGWGRNSTEISVRCPPLICFQFITSLKSYTWQHNIMCSSKSLLTFFPKPRVFEILCSKSWFPTDSSTEAPDGITLTLFLPPHQLARFFSRHIKIFSYFHYFLTKVSWIYS